MQRRAACAAALWASTLHNTVSSCSSANRRHLPPLLPTLRRRLSTANTSAPSSSSTSTANDPPSSAFPSSSSSSTAGAEPLVCPPPLSRYFAPAAPDAAVFRRYVQCLEQRVVDPDLPPLPSSAHVRPAASSFPTARPLISKDAEIFANQDCPLQHILWWGFDFDYTLASYNDQLGHLIYEEAKQYLIHRLGYPRELGRCSFDPSFAIRGLHFDDRTGYLLKLDQFGKVQLDTVHKGRQKVPVDEIVSRYNGITVSKEYEEQHLHLKADLFCLPEICLLADTIQTFLDSTHDFSPDYVYRDVFRAIEYTHTSGKLHDAITADPSNFLEPNPEMRELLERLRKAGKKTFLLTNSSFNFVDAGMRYMLGLPPPPPRPDLHPPSDSAPVPVRPSSSSPSSSSSSPSSSSSLPSSSSTSSPSPSSSWLDLFDVSIFSARKPRFWQRKNANFRLIDQRTGALSFHSVSELHRGEAYTHGGLDEFERLTGASASNVIYCGDNTAADLVTPSESGLWKTVAIMKEMSHEAGVMQSLPFRRSLKRLLEVEGLIDFGQRLEDAASKALIEELKQKRKLLKRQLLTMFNPHFGSAFRTASHRTMLFSQVSRYADVYTSSIANFNHYPLHYCFYAKRSFFPHELEYELIMSTHDGEQAAPSPEQQPQPASAQQAKAAGTVAHEGRAAAATANHNSKEEQSVRGEATPTAQASSGGEQNNPLQRGDASEAEKREQLGQ